MNFTQEIKRELIRSVPEKRCCKCALLAGIFDTCGDWEFGLKNRPDGFSFTSESEEIAGYLLGIVEQLFGVQMALTEAVRDPKHGRDKLTFAYRGGNAFEYADEISDYRPYDGIGECCALSYVKGAFLGGGSCTLPKEGTKTGYHLEFVFDGSSERGAEPCRDALDRIQIFSNTLGRGERRVVYLKSREAICDFLSVVGAESALGTLEKLSAVREENNNRNRVENCMAGNADRAATASVAQTVTFDRLRRNGTAEKLPPALLSVLEARLENPTLSLAELAEQLHVSKSCLNHRIRRLMRIAEEKGSL